MKRQNALQISEILGIEGPDEIPGGTISKEWLSAAISAAPGCEDIDVESKGKQEILKAAIECLGGSWDESCESKGGTITANALSKFAVCIDPRIEEMRNIWTILGKEGYPSVDQSEFVSQLYNHYFEKEMTDGIGESLIELLQHIDDNHGLNDDEIYTDDQVTKLSYQVIQAHLLQEKIPEEEDSEEEDERVTRITNADVQAMQIATIWNFWKEGLLNLNPPWQRGDVWSPWSKKRLIESVLLNIPLPSIILHELPGGEIEVIDGQQRLRSIIQFMEGKFRLPNFKSDHDLFDIKGSYYNHQTRKEIGAEHRRMFMLTKVPVLMFRRVDEPRLRKIFNLYNTAALKLNPAEIRNATYQSHPIHQMAFILAGENPEAEIFYVDKEKQERFTLDFRDLMSSTKRFATTEVICRYLAHSRPQRSVNSTVFKGSSTSKSINRFLDTFRTNDDAELSAYVQEVIDAYNFTEEYFDDISDEHMSFERLDKNGTPKFNQLVTITNMVASRMLISLRDAEFVEEKDIRPAIEATIRGVEWPENQNAGTIWQYQADVINGLLQNLGIESGDENVRVILPHLIPCMDEIRRVE